MRSTTHMRPHLAYRAYERVSRSSSATLQAGYGLALVLATVQTLACAALLTTVDFATVTKSLIIATVAPLVLSWGVPDAMTFRALQDSSGRSSFTAGLTATSALSALAFGAVYAYSRGQGLDASQAISTGTVSTCAMLMMSCQGVELAVDRVRQVAVFAGAPGAVSLGLLCGLWAADWLNATTVLGARATGALLIVLWRLTSISHGLDRTNLAEIWQVLRLGTPIHVSSVLAAGSLRLEQALVLEHFSVRALAAYGLVMPAVNGIRTLLYGAGTAEAVALARVGNRSLWHCHRRLRRLALVGGVLGVVAALAVVVIAWLTGLSGAIPPSAILLFILGGTASGLIDVLVRMYRGSGDARYGVLARVVGLVITATLGPWLISSGASSASVVGILAGVAAYALLLTAALSKGNQR